MIDDPSSTPAAPAALQSEDSVSASAAAFGLKMEEEKHRQNEQPARSESVASAGPFPENVAPAPEVKSAPIADAKEAKAAPVTAQTEAPKATADPELGKLSQDLHRGHSSHYAFGNVSRVAVPDHLLLLNGLTVLTGPAAGELTPYQSEVRLANQPASFLVASIWLANFHRPHGRRVHIVLIDTQSHTAVAVVPTVLVGPPTHLDQPIRPSDAAFASQAQVEAQLIADETAKAQSQHERGPAGRELLPSHALRSSKTLV